MNNEAGPAPGATGSLCDDCAAKCCRYIALEIDTPRSRADFDDLRWYLCHKQTVIYVSDDKWYLHMLVDCRYRGPDSLCTIYDRRPKICREHSTEDCEHGEPWEYQLKFTDLDELEIYVAARFA
jgi:Fe-S-cluster containining protein